MNCLRLLPSSARLTLAAIGIFAIAGTANAYIVDFDGVTSGGLANSAAPTGVSFVHAYYTPDVDAFGDPIPGTEKWRADPTAPEVLVKNPLERDYGPAPSPNNALEAIDQPVLLRFDTPQALQSFSAVLDNSTLGSPTPLNIEFLDAAGQIIRSVASDQTAPGFIVSTGPISNLSAVLLQGGAFYDNINIAPVPEPGEYAMMLAGLAVVAGLARRCRVQLS